MEEISRSRVRAPHWQVRPSDQETAERFAEILGEDPNALPPPDYVLAPDMVLEGSAEPAVLIGTGFVRSLATFVVLKRPSIIARVWSTDGDPSELAFRLALNEDALGPRPMSIADRVRNAIHFHELYPTLSHRQIAKEVGLSHTKVDQLAENGWQVVRRASQEREFDPLGTARRAVRALLELDREVGTRSAGAWLGEALWDLTPEGEEMSTVDCINRAIDRAGRYVEKEAGKT
jgi:hypothetical protein